MGGTNEIIKEIVADSTSILECSNSCAHGCGCDCDCCKSEQALCIANSVCSSNITIDTSPSPLIPQLIILPLAAPSSSVSVKIPNKSCITKIYASMPNAPEKAKYILIEILDVNSAKIFCHALPNQPSTGIIFDTTLVQPLCVGNITPPTPAIATVTALDQNNKPVEEFLTLTVVYCPNCC